MLLTKLKLVQFIKAYSCMAYLIKIPLAKEVALFNDVSSGFK